MNYLSGLVPSRYFIRAVAVYSQGSLQYSIVQKLLLGKSFPPSPAFQNSLWKSVPPVSFFSGLVPSRHAVVVYYRGSLQCSIVQKLYLGKSFPPSPAFQSSLWKSVPPVSSLSGLVLSSFGDCSGLLPGVSPVFGCTEIILGEIFSTFASLPELSLEARPPGEFSLGFDTIKASIWHCTKPLPEVSPVFDRTKTTLRDFVPPSLAFQSSLWKSVPPVSSLSGSVPSRHLFGAVAVYYRGSLQCSIVQKLYLGKSFQHPSAFQSSLWKRVPSVSSLSGSVPSRHLFGAVVIYYQRSLQYSIVQKLLLGKSFPLTPAFQRSLWKCFLPVSSLSGSVPSRHLFGAVVIYYRWSLQYSIAQKLFLGTYFPHTPAFQRSLWKCAPPEKFSLGSVPSRHLFGAVAVYYQRSLQYSIVKKLFLRKSFPHTPAFQRFLRKCAPLVSSFSDSVPSRHRFGAAPC